MKKINFSAQMVGKTYNSLTVLAALGVNRWGQSTVRVVCKCGQKKRFIACLVKNGTKKTCAEGACRAQLKNITGRKFGFLTAIEFDRKASKSSWIFECHCGTKKSIRTQAVLHGKQKSCGCYNGRLGAQTRRKNKSLAMLVSTKCFKEHCCNAKKRGIKQQLSANQYNKIVKQSCHYCGGMSTRKWGLHGETYALNSVDRKNSTKHYSKDNCVPCCITCNWMKGARTPEEFLAHVAKIGLYSAAS